LGRGVSSDTGELRGCVIEEGGCRIGGLEIEGGIVREGWRGFVDGGCINIGCDIEGCRIEVGCIMGAVCNTGGCLIVGLDIAGCIVGCIVDGGRMDTG
jgi:hypothetical protein